MCCTLHIFCDYWISIWTALAKTVKVTESIWWTLNAENPHLMITLELWPPDYEDHVFIDDSFLFNSLLFQLAVVFPLKLYCTLMTRYFSLKCGQFTLTCFQSRIPYYNISNSWSPGIPCGESQRQQISREGLWPTARQRFLPKAAKIKAQCNRNVFFLVKDVIHCYLSQ